MGQSPSDIVDGDFSYAPVSSGAEDGCVGWQNNDFNQLLKVNATIDLGQTANISRIRYSMGNVQRADTWGGDYITTPLGRTAVVPGVPFMGTWTTQTGTMSAPIVSVSVEKTRTSVERDWLFIGEIQAWGVPPAAWAVASASILGVNNSSADPISATGMPDGQFVALGVGGEAVLDLGTDVLDSPGPDVVVSIPQDPGGLARSSSATTTPTNSYIVYGSPDGWEWTLLGQSSETAEFDFAASGLEAVRFVRVSDGGTGDSLSAAPGVHLDAVVAAAANITADVVPSLSYQRPKLSPPWPNPSIGRTQMSLVLPIAGRASLTIYDIAGRAIRELVSSPLSAGPHTLQWDGTDGAGERVRPGVYICRVTMAGHSASQRLVVLQ
jgi:hypothetical protein